MKYYCNPLNIPYKYQFNKSSDGGLTVSRESADPSMIMFNGRYFIFPSMTCGFLYSDDLVSWQFHPLTSIPVYEYAPDVRVFGEYVYFCASNHEQGRFFRTTDPFEDNFEEIEAAFPFWDPNLFLDDNGRAYFYWGSSTSAPIYGIELDPKTMQPLGKREELIFCRDSELGYERSGENHIPERTPEEIEQALIHFHKNSGSLSGETKAAAEAFIRCKPYIEGAWMTKHKDTYYLQYAVPSSRNNIYADGVYISNSPLGPFELAKNNPFSYKPGGFIPGAGHGSTMQDKHGNGWHVATNRISINHNFERRLGLWPVDWDADGEMFCNQRFGDWPTRVDQQSNDPWADPEWMLLSYKKPAKASSNDDHKTPDLATDENVQTWWRAETSNSGEWLEVDLGKECQVNAIQINFADDELSLSLPENVSLTGDSQLPRWIDDKQQVTRWQLEGSLDGVNYWMIEDKSEVETDLPHDLIVCEEGIKTRYIRLTVIELPYKQTACVSGLRVFGIGEGNKPEAATEIQIVGRSMLDIDVSWKGKATGYVVLWGHQPDKLYHSYQVFTDHVSIGGLVAGQETYLRIDSFNENGITKGEIIEAR
jgi:hypothetical protein